MKKNYSGNQKPFVLVLLAQDAKDRLTPLLEQLDERGLQLCVKGENEKCESEAKKACATIAVLSGGFAKSANLQSALLKAEEYSRLIVPVLADKSEQSELTKRALFSKNAVDTEKYPDAVSLADRVMSADALKSPFLTDEQKKQSGRIRRTIIAVAAAVVLSSVAYLFSRFGQIENEVQITEPASSPSIIDNYGWTEEELAKVSSLVIYGDKIGVDKNIHNSKTMWNFVMMSWNDRGEYTWMTVDGEDVGMSENTDLSFVSKFPNINYLALINQSAEEFPDLSNNSSLIRIDINDCNFRNLEGLRGTKIMDASISTAVTDFSPLGDCRFLSTLTLYDGVDYTYESLYGLKSDSLKTLTFHSKDVKDLSAIGDCPNIESLTLEGCGTERRLDMSFLGKLTKLQNLRLDQFYGIDDVSALENCPNLKVIQLQDTRSVTDLSCLEGLTNLKEIQVHAGISNLDFLKGLSGKSGVTLAFSGDALTDYSELEAVKKYSFLHCNLQSRPYSVVADFIEDAEVKTLQLYNVSDIDYERLPNNISNLHLMQCHDGSLKGIEAVSGVCSLQLEDNKRLTSIDGIEKIERLSSIIIRNCPVSDYEPLYEKTWSELRLSSLRMLPDFSRIEFEDRSSFEVSDMPIESVDFFDDFPDSATGVYFESVDLSGLDGVNDISPLKRFHGYKLTVGPQLESQAAELVENGNFKEYEIDYSGYEWEINRFYLLSFDETETLMPSYLDNIMELHLYAGVLNGADCYENNGNFVVTYGDGSEEILKGRGTEKNLDRILKLTNLFSLDIRHNQIESLAGLDELHNLTFLIIIDEPVKDFSPMFAATSLREISIVNTGIESLEGIENLYNLESLRVPWNNGLTDLTPILALDNLREVTVSANMEKAIASLDGQDYSFEIIIE